MRKVNVFINDVNPYPPDFIGAVYQCVKSMEENYEASGIRPSGAVVRDSVLGSNSPFKVFVTQMVVEANRGIYLFDYRGEVHNTNEVKKNYPNNLENYQEIINRYL